MKLEEFDSPIGGVFLVSEAGAVRAVDFAAYRERMWRLLLKHWGSTGLEFASARTDFRARLEDYFAGEIAAIDKLPVATRGTAFQESVWSALRAIPAGATVTYAQLAERIGQPKAIRAAGFANSLNPVAIVIPCHRVVGTDGSLTGYAGGLKRKQWLLRHEGAQSKRPLRP